MLVRQEDARCSWLYETLEGGPGFWVGQLPTVVPKYRVNGVAGCYADETASHLFHFGSTAPKECASLGLVQLSNSVLLPPDGLTFAREGMLGIAWVRTPFGKTDATDARNFWTFVIDAQNVAGPVAYFLPEFWQTRAKGQVSTVWV